MLVAEAYANYAEKRASMRRGKIALLLTALLLVSLQTAALPPAKDAAAGTFAADDPLTSPRTAWWREARFGMFIHWGLYAQLAGEWQGQRTPSVGEWIMRHLAIPPVEYEAVAPQFNPTSFDA